MLIQKHSKWTVTLEGTRVELEVVGIWATGGGPNYTPHSYELKVSDTGDIIKCSRLELIELIEIEKAKTKKT